MRINIIQELNLVSTPDEFRHFISQLRVICSNEKSINIENLIDQAIAKNKIYGNNKTLIDLFDLKIRQIYHFKDRIHEALEILSKMRSLSKISDYSTGLALSEQLSWHVEKLLGNKARSFESIKNAMKITESSDVDEYAKNFCRYSYAVENWLRYRDYECANMLEESADFFYSEGFFHGLVGTLGILTIIYQQTQNKQQSMKLTKKILRKDNLFRKLPKELQSTICFFIGFSNELSLNLREAEMYLLKSQIILKPIYGKSIYSGYYLTTLSYLTATYALQGKLELALKQMKEVEELVIEGIATKNLDSFGIEQTLHIFNLSKFYINSRLSNFTIEIEQELVQSILDNLDKYYSNPIMFSEFLLNANLTKEQLIKIKNLKNPSTRRVEHIINFLVEKTVHTEEQQILRYTTILQKRLMVERMTYIEKAFADLLAAQEYYKIGRFSEIYPLLKKHKNQLDRIEVLEMRIFMEAFIQAGEFNNGDPLAPALHFMAIKRCREHNFTRLEETLLDHQQTLRRIALNRLV
ncbi:MAG: hypothetical protein HGN29_11745 [Asgard group archaeon]|nr:hypothetical protein [Asgard group archaeon]